MQSGRDGSDWTRSAPNPTTGVLRGGSPDTETHAGRVPHDHGGGDAAAVCSARVARAASTPGIYGKGLHRPACHPAASGAPASTMVTVSSAAESHHLVVPGDSGPRTFTQGPARDSPVTFLKVKNRKCSTPGGILMGPRKALRGHFGGGAQRLLQLQ